MVESIAICKWHMTMPAGVARQSGNHLSDVSRSVTGLSACTSNNHNYVHEMQCLVKLHKDEDLPIKLRFVSLKDGSNFLRIEIWVAILTEVRPPTTLG